jgi:CheY-like chemotaxis protein
MTDTTKFILPPNGSSGQPTPRAKILVVDDTAANRMAFEQVLSDLGDVVLSSSGREALHYLLEEEFAVILLDIRMPEMDGIETATVIRNGGRAKHTPIIFVSAYDKTPLEVAEGRLGGSIDYLFSPVDPEALRRKASSLIALYLLNLEQKRQLQDALAANERHEARIKALETDLESLRQSLARPL